MADYVTKQDVQEIVNRAVEDLANIIHDFSNQVAANFEKIDEQLDRIETRVDNLEGQMESVLRRLADHSDRLTSVEITLRNLQGEVLHLRKSQEARDVIFSQRLDRAEGNIKRIAAKLGMKLAKA